MVLILLILVIILLVTMPSWPYSRDWGPTPSGLIGIILVVLLILLLAGRLHI